MGSFKVVELMGTPRDPNDWLPDWLPAWIRTHWYAVLWCLVGILLTVLALALSGCGIYRIMPGRDW